jgi:uncharacterized protein (DUF4415 family)
MKVAITRKLTAEEQAALDAVAAMPDSEIDTSDMPEVTDWSRAVRGALYRPVKRLTSLRLDADLLEWFKRGGRAPSELKPGCTRSCTKFPIPGRGQRAETNTAWPQSHRLEPA